MKKWLCIALFVFSFSHAQNDSIAKPIGVVAADKMNVVYRGFNNPISIAVPDCKSFTASGIGLTEISKGKYNLAPGAGDYAIITLHIIKNDGTEVTEEHSFEIRSIAKPDSLINGLSGVVTMSQEEFSTAVVSLSEVVFGVVFNVIGFSVKVEGQKKIAVKGNSLKDIEIPGIFPGCQIVITDIKAKGNIDAYICGIGIIVVRIYDPDLYKKNKSYRKQYDKRMLKDVKEEIKWRHAALDTTPKFTKYEKDSISRIRKMIRLDLKKKKSLKKK